MKLTRYRLIYDIATDVDVVIPKELQKNSSLTYDTVLNVYRKHPYVLDNIYQYLNRVETETDLLDDVFNEMPFPFLYDNILDYGYVDDCDDIANTIIGSFVIDFAYSSELSYDEIFEVQNYLHDFTSGCQRKVGVDWEPDEVENAEQLSKCSIVVNFDCVNPTFEEIK